MRNTTINGLILTTMFLGGLNLTTKATNTPNGETRLNLRLFAYVPGTNSCTETMKEKVVEIFAQSWIQVSWTGCIRNGEATGDSRCTAPRSANEVYVRIVVGEVGRENALDPGALGFAAPGGSLVTVFYRSAEKLSGPGRANIGQVLGYAVAHEVGHIILGAGAHTTRGLMQARWTKKTATEMLHGLLGFSRQQAELLKAHFLNQCALTGKPIIAD